MNSYPWLSNSMDHVGSVTGVTVYGSGNEVCNEY